MVCVQARVTFSRAVAPVHGTSEGKGGFRAFAPKPPRVLLFSLRCSLPHPQGEDGGETSETQ